MRALDERAARIMNALVAPLVGGTVHHRWEKPDSAYMAAVIEKLYTLDEDNPVYSLAHYFKLNGDLCQDPDVEFWHTGHLWYPCMYQQAIPPVYQQCIDVSGWPTPPHVTNEGHQESITSFCNQWLRTIAEQQELTLTSEEIPV